MVSVLNEDQRETCNFLKIKKLSFRVAWKIQSPNIATDIFRLHFIHGIFFDMPFLKGLLFPAKKKVPPKKGKKKIRQHTESIFPAI